MAEKPLSKGYAEEARRLSRAFGNLPDPPPRPLRTDTKRYLIEQLREPFLAALATRGYTVRMLADFLKAQDVEIALPTLYRYLGPIGPYRYAWRRPPEAAWTAGLESQNRFPEPAPVPAFSDAPDSASSNAIPIRAAWPEQSAVPAAPARETKPAAGTGRLAASSAKPPLALASRFTPKPEIPWEEFVQGAATAEEEAVGHSLGEAAESARRAAPPVDPAQPHPSSVEARR